MLIVNNFLSYSGMEMNAVHVASLKDPAKEFPRAMFFACGLVLLIFILPALAISWVIPADELSLTAGVMQAFDAFFAYFDLQKLVPIVAIALVCASAGGMLTWLAGPSKGLLLIARREGYLPPFFQQQNENEVAVNILVVQGGVTTVIALLYALVPSVSSAYWILSVMTTQVYLIVYLLMFVAAVSLRTRQPNVERGYRAPPQVPVRRRLARLGRRDPHRLRAAVAVRERQRRRVRRADPGRHGAARPAPAVAVPEVPKARLEEGRRGGDVMSDPAPTPPEPAAGNDNSWMYWISAPWSSSWSSSASITYSRQKADQEAQQKAAAAHPEVPEGGAARARPGHPHPVAGHRWRAVCDNPANALGKATLNDKITNGADFVGRRPVIIDRRILLGEALILQTYCPDKLKAYQDKIDNLKYDNTVKQ